MKLQAVFVITRRQKSEELRVEGLGFRVLGLNPKKVMLLLHWGGPGILGRFHLLILERGFGYNPYVL